MSPLVLQKTAQRQGHSIGGHGVQTEQEEQKKQRRIEEG
jgi:hypothetical protein